MKILGINDDVTTCECCGRTNLKKTVVLSTGEGEVHYGEVCAARALGRDSASVRKESLAARRATEQATAIARQREADAEWERYSAWLRGKGYDGSNLARRREWRAEGGV